MSRYVGSASGGFADAIKNLFGRLGKASIDFGFGSGSDGSGSYGTGFPDSSDLLGIFGNTDLGLNSTDTNFGDILSRINSINGASDDPVINAIITLGIQQNQALSGSQRDDWNKQLVDTLLQYVLTKENRLYNENLRDEDRLYNNPTNALARLMGAGISRDAAIQMLNSASGSGASSGVPYSQVSQAAQGIAPSQSRLNELQGKLGIAQTVFGGISSIASLVSCGMSIPQAISQNKILKNQAVLSQESLQGLNSANKVFNALGNAVTTGAISMDTLNGFTNAQDALNYLYDHQDTNAFKGIFADGSYNNVLGTSFGRNSFSSLWHDFSDTKNYGKQLEQEIRRSDLQNELYSIQGRAAQRDYFFGFQSALNGLMKDNAEIANLWNDFQSGKYQVLIDGERLTQAKHATKIVALSQTHAERESFREGVEFTAFKNFVENGEPDEPLEGSATGQDIINYVTFGNWYDKLQSQLVRLSANDFVHGKDGKLKQDEFGHFVSPRDDYKNYLRNHQDLLYTGAFIQQIIQDGRLNSWQGDAKPIWQFFDMWRASGASDFVSTAAKTAGDVGASVVPFVL